MKNSATPFETEPLADLKLTGLSSKWLKILAAADLLTVGDLLSFLPRDYADYSKVTPICDASLTVDLHIQGRVLQKMLSHTHQTKMPLLETLIDDGSGTLRAVWFNQKWLNNKFEKGAQLSLFGKVRFERMGRTMNNPKLKVLTSQEVVTANIEPIYRQVGGISSDKLRGWISQLIASYPQAVSGTPCPLGLPSRLAAFTSLHKPQDEMAVKAIQDHQHPGFKRLVFDEFLAFQLRLLRLQSGRSHEAYLRLQPPPGWLESFLKTLPFQLTTDQQEVLSNLQEQLLGQGRLHALIQGDVGSGKTVIGLAIASLFTRSGLQAALLCPTTVLAAQHYATACTLLRPLGVEVALLSGQQSKADQLSVLQAIECGSAQLVVGTHRLLQKDVLFEKLALVLVDEQHRFGVNQRASLLKKGCHPHYLAFSATPIPRSLAMTLYGDFEVHQIRNKPPGRGQLHTILKKAANRDQVIEFVRYRISQGESVFWVFPLIDEGEQEHQRQFNSASATYEHFRSGILPDVGLVHGRLSAEEMSARMADFKAGRLKVLVATTVIEVGVDVPHASVMVVEGADHFGLSQLHQLRGRVGRSGSDAYCFLMAGPRLSRAGLERLELLKQSNDGFAIAEFDLRQRGVGDVLGNQQTGFSRFCFGDPWRDRVLMQEARRFAAQQLEQARLSP